MRTIVWPGVLAFCLAIPAGAQSDRADVYKLPRQAERVRDYDALHYRIKIRFDEDKKSFWGENTVTLAPLRDAFDTIVLDAAELKVTAATDDAGDALPYRQDTASVTISLPRKYAYHEKLSVTLEYESHDPRPDPAKYGMSPDYRLGLHFWEESAAHPRLISTLSFPEGARHWFPCNDVPADKATAELFITVRKEYEALSNGRLVQVTDDSGGTRTFHWSQEQPHSTYLFVIAAGPYKIITDRFGPVPLQYWVYPKDEQNALRSFGKTPEVLRFLSEEYGYPFPWPKYVQVTIPGIGGGAESTSATVIGESVIHDERAEQDFPTAWLVAHEAAHQWWGDLVTMRSWKDTWLNESFATYGEYRYAVAAGGEDEGAVNMLEKKEAYFLEARTLYQRPIVFDRYQFPNQNFDRHTYQKGAAVLRLLRSVMGDADFQRSISAFLHAYAFRPADTHDLQNVIKDTTGQNLDWFFEQWIYKPGHPVLDVSYSWDEASRQIRLKVAQKQGATNGTPIFRAPVRVEWRTSGGTQQQQIWLQHDEEVFTFPARERPQMVRFDRGDYLVAEIHFSKPVDELIYQLQHDDVTGRIWAAGELAKVGSEAAAQALRVAAKGDSFWAVRRSAVQGLGKLRQRADQTFLRERALDANSRVRVAALAALGDYSDPGLAGFLRVRFRQDTSYAAQAEALRAMARTGSADARALLTEALGMASPRDVLKKAAESGLKVLDSKAAGAKP